MIAFSGLDGAGKSTQIAMIAEYYKINNIRFSIFWSRGGYTAGINFLKKLFLIKSKSKNHNTPVKLKKREKYFSNPFVRKVWLTLAICDLIFFYAIYIRINELLGTKIICDRYIYDTQIDFKLNFPQENFDNWFLWKCLSIIAVKPRKYFVLTVSLNESQKRSKMKNEPFPDSRETLEKRLEFYLNFVKKSDSYIHIDGSQDVDLVHELILKEIVV